MSVITFDDVMSFYPKHNQAIYNMIVSAQKQYNLIPFVGAGLSKFCGYKLWGDVLKELSEYILENDKSQTVLAQIGSGAYEQAAQSILEAYPAMLDQLPALISTDKLSACPQEQLRSSAAFVLPYLFQQGLVVTTNFDRVLESMYLMHKGNPIQTMTPNQQDLLAQLRQNQSLGLFKLHGDIGSGTVSIEDLVFTAEQYEKKYAPGSPLVQELTRWFESRRLLFVGCSLNADRTMDVLQAVTASQPGIRHYAILGCKKADIPQRLHDLSTLGILPIFYDDSNHDAVRVILERLLEETDQSAYKKLWTASRVIPAAAKEERRLLFDADYFPFTGRQKELETLEAFCSVDDSISWWAVTGPGGMGKSRLVYEFANQKYQEGWQIQRFESRPSKDSAASCIEALETWIPDVCRTIVVLDDVQAHMDMVKRWLNAVVHCPRSEKLRILLLEREGKDLGSATWLGADPCDDTPDEWCYQKDFLCLQTMTDADLIHIMDDYAAAAGKTLNAQLLLKTLERVDPELKRPMYAVAIADARCQGSDPTNWDRKKVLDALLNRELDFHFNRFHGMTGKGATKALRTELKDLMARSCIHGFLMLDDADIDRYPKLTKKINDMDMDLQEFLEGLGVLRTVLMRSITLDRWGNPTGKPPKEERHKVISLSCPDLIKEHMVLNLALEGSKRELLFPENWDQNPGQLSFILKLLMDYSDRLQEHPDFWNTFFQAAPKSILPAKIYGHTLWGYAVNYRDRAGDAADRLARLYDETNREPEIAECYAHTLFIISMEKTQAEQSDAVSKLEQLYENHRGNPEVIELFAKGLTAPTLQNDLRACTQSVTRLEQLYRDHSELPEVADQLAQALVNLSCDQPPEGCDQTVDRLEQLYQDLGRPPHIAIHLACGLVNLAGDQDLEGCTETVARLEQLYQDHKDLPQIIDKFATGLSYLTCEQAQDPANCAQTVAKLEQLYVEHKDVPGIANTLATGLVNLSCEQDLVNCASTVAKLEQLYQNHGNLPTITKRFGMGLTNLSFLQDPNGHIQTLQQLGALHRTHPENPDIAVQLIRSLSNLIGKQSLDHEEEIIARCEQIYSCFPDSEHVAQELAGCLVNLSFHQKSEEAVRQTLHRSNVLTNTYPENSSLQLRHAMTWFNLTLQQEDADIPATVTEIAAFLQNYPDAIPPFKDALDVYLSTHPDHTTRYQPLLKL